MKKIVSKGFTLIELLIVVAIIGVVCGATIPRLTRKKTTFPMTITLYSQEEYEEVMSAFTYYNKYRESMMMERIIWRME